MLLCLGLDSQFAMVETLMAALHDIPQAATPPPCIPALHTLHTLTHPHTPSHILTGAHALLVVTDARLPRGLRSTHLPGRPARLPARLCLWRPLRLCAAPLGREGVGARAPRAEWLVLRDGTPLT